MTDHEEIADLRHELEAARILRDQAQQRAEDLERRLHEMSELLAERTAERDSAVQDLYQIEQQREPGDRLVAVLRGAIEANWPERHHALHRLLIRRDLRYLRELLA